MLMQGIKKGVEMSKINDLNQKKKGFSIGKIFLILIVLGLTIKDIVWQNSFLIFLTSIFETINIQITTVILLFIMLLCLVIPLIKLKNITPNSYIAYLEESKCQTIFTITAILCFCLFYFGGEVWHYQNIKSINYYFDKNNEIYNCNFNIKNQTFDGECDNEFLQRVESLRNEGVKFDKKEFLELVLDYENKNKLELWSSFDDEPYVNIIHTRNKEVFNHLLFKATNQ
ncbi:putative membrane protein (plasmid) [Campylobacter sp. RM12651]|nr:putative membrane protein [Campylobacter sp. RM12651]